MRGHCSVENLTGSGDGMDGPFLHPCPAAERVSGELAMLRTHALPERTLSTRLQAQSTHGRVETSVICLAFARFELSDSGHGFGDGLSLVESPSVPAIRVGRVRCALECFSVFVVVARVLLAFHLRAWPANVSNLVHSGLGCVARTAGVTGIRTRDRLSIDGPDRTDNHLRCGRVR